MSSSACCFISEVVTGISEDSSETLAIKRDAAWGAAVLVSLNATHSVSNINERAAVAPMSNNRCKSISGYSVSCGNECMEVQGLYHLHAMGGIWKAF